MRVVGIREVAFTAALVTALMIGGNGQARAAELEGASFPDTASVGGTTVQLNGLGLRKAYVFVKVYVAALYLQTKTHDGKTATDTDEAKRIVLHFLREVTHDQMKEAWKEGFAVTGSKAIEPQIQQFDGYFTEPIKAGEQYVFDYAPGKGTTVTIAKQVKGTIPGADFMRALWGIWLGPKPPSEDLKAGMLGSE